jgi:glutathione synthase
MLPNLNQMVESISRDGYVIAQEYLPAAQEGDIRLFSDEWRPRCAIRENMLPFVVNALAKTCAATFHAGGKKSTGHDRPDRAADRRKSCAQNWSKTACFLVGLDIVGDKLMEINVFSPGGLGSAKSFEKVNFSNAVLDALERKVEYIAVL